MAANYPSATAAPTAASSPFSWVPRQMLSGDAAEEEGDSDGDSDRGDEDRGEGDEAELVIDIPNEWAWVCVDMRVYLYESERCVSCGPPCGFLLEYHCQKQIPE